MCVNVNLYSNFKNRFFKISLEVLKTSVLVRSSHIEKDIVFLDRNYVKVTCLINGAGFHNSTGLN